MTRTGLPAAPEFAAPVSDRPAAPPGFDLLDEVGRGGMGVVYRARDLALGREVAVKVLQGRFSHDGPAARRFVGEARITGQLQHPGIPAVHHVGTLPDGRPFLAMKLIKGRTLDDLVKERGDRPADHGHLLVVFAAVCQAVAYAHAHRVIHRDLKPENIMVGAFGEVQVMDWGLAKVFAGPGIPSAEEADVAEVTAPAITEIESDRDADSSQTRSGSVLGTPAYMPPEQAIGAIDQLDARSDVFGLGAILCAVLTGRPPYLAADTEATRRLAARAKLDDCHARLDACGAEADLVALCKRCLSPEKADRPADAEVVAEAVAAHLAAAEERARRAELDRVRSEEQRKRRRVQWTLAATALGLVVVAALGAALFAERHQTEVARDEAVRQSGLADEARAVAVAAQGDAEREREKLAALEYGRTIQVAHQEWRDNDLVGTRTLLAGTQPHRRGWEWHYVHRLCHADLLTLKGNEGDVESAAFSPDGSRVVTAGWDKTAKVWDANTGDLLLTLWGHGHVVSSAAFSPDGSRIVTASGDQTAKVWDATSGAVHLTCKGHTIALRSAVFSPDGTRIVTASFDKSARVWDVKSGAELLTFKGHAGTVATVAFSPDGSRIVTAGDKTARVWDARPVNRAFLPKKP